MSLRDPANVASRPSLRLLQAALLLAAVCAVPRAWALNKLLSPGFEASVTPSTDWTATPKNGSATENSFGPVNSFIAGTTTAKPYEGNLAFLGRWSNSGSSSSASRTLIQTFTPSNAVNARLRGFYWRTGSGQIKSFSLAFSIKDSTGTTLSTTGPLAAGTGNAIIDSGWQTANWSTSVKLQAGTVYTIEISWSAAFQTVGSQGAAVDLVELQVSPAGLAADASSGPVVLSWQPSTGTPGLRAVNPYQVYRRSASETRSLIGAAGTTSFTDSGIPAAPLAPNTNYFYEVTDFSTANEESPASVEVSALTLPAAPGAPTFSAITETGMKVSWTAPAGGAEGYRLERAPDASGAPGTWNQISAPVEPFFDDAGLSCGTTYWYRVRATNSTGAGPWSVASSQATAACPALTVGDSTANPSASTRCPHETAAQPVDVFTLQTSKGTDAVTSVTLTLGAGNAAALARVQITAADGTTVLGEAVEPTSDTVTLPVSGMTAVAGAPTVYRVFVLPKGHAQMPQGSFAVTAHVSAVESGYTQRTYEDASGGPVTFDNQAPAMPTWSSVGASDARVTLVWNAVPDADLYLMLRGTSEVTAVPEENTSYAVGADLGGFTVRHSSANTNLDDTTVVNGTPYHYRLTARDSCGNWSPGILIGPMMPKGTITVGEGNNIADANLCPGAPSAAVDGFSLKVSNDTDTVTAVSVTFEPGAVAALSLVEITDNAGAVLGSAAPSDLTVVDLAAPISVTTAAVNYRVRVTLKPEAQLPQPGALHEVRALVTGVECFSDVVVQDFNSATLALDDQAPAAPVLDATVGDSKVDLSWANTGTGVVLLRDASPITAVPVEASAYSTGDFIGSARVIYAGAGTSYSDVSAVNGTAYHYALFAYDGCKNYSAVGASGAQTPRGTTTIGDGTDPANGTPVCPGDAARVLDAFALRASQDTDTITSVTVGFAPGTAEALALVEITDAAGNTVLGSALLPTDTTTVSLTTPIVATTTNVQYRVRVTPKAAADMPPAPGARYQVSGNVTTVACANAVTDNDGSSATLTLDNESPAAPAWASLVDDDGRVDLSWSSSGAGVLLLRASSPISQAPAEGASYANGEAVGAATVVYTGTATSYSDTAVTNGTTYHYALFVYDGCRNYSAGLASGPRVPNAAITTLGDGTALADSELCPGGEPVDVDAFTLQTSRGADQIGALTVRLAAGTAGAVARVDIVSDDGGTVFGGADDPAADQVALTLTTPLAAGTTPTQYRIRLTPRTHAAMPASPGALHELGATVESFESANLKAGSDATSAVASVDNLSPEAVAWGEIVSAEATLALSWTASADAEQVLVLRSLAEVDGVPAEGSQYMAGATLGNASVAYAGAGAGFSDLGLGDGMEYWYAAFARDACGNWSVAAPVGPVVPGEPTTILGDAADPGDASVCPGSEAQPVDAFELKTSWGVDRVTELTLELGEGNAEAIALVEVTSADGRTIYGSAAEPGADVLSIALDTALPVGPVPATFGVRLTPRAHDRLPAPPGKVYEVGCRVVSFTATNASVGSDPGSTTLTIDNASPAAPQFWPAVDDNGQVTLSWSGPQDSELDGYLLARGAGELPREGESYEAGASLGTSAVVYAGAATSHSEPRPEDEQTVYRLFVSDRCGNWSEAAEQKPLKPTTDGGEPVAAMGAYDLGGCGCAQGAGPLALMAGLFSLVALRRRRHP